MRHARRIEGERAHGEKKRESETWREQQGFPLTQSVVSSDYGSDHEDSSPRHHEPFEASRKRREEAVEDEKGASL